MAALFSGERRSSGLFGGRSSAALTDPREKANASVQRRIDALRGIGVEPPETKTLDPGPLARIIAALNPVGESLSAMNRAQAYNRASALTEGGTRDMPLERVWLENLGGILPAIYYGATGPMNPLEEAGKALRGERTVSMADVDKEFIEPSVVRNLGEGSLLAGLYSHPAARFTRGLAGDIVSDPTTLVGLGSTGITKSVMASGSKALAGLSVKGVDAAADAARIAQLAARAQELADTGYDISKHADVAEMFAGARPLGAVGKEGQRSLATALRHEAALKFNQPEGINVLGTSIPGLKGTGEAVQPALEAFAYKAKDIARMTPLKRLESIVGREDVVAAAQKGLEVSKEALRLANRAGAGVAGKTMHEATELGSAYMKDVPDDVRVATTIANDEAMTPWREPLKRAFSNLKRAKAAMSAGMSKVKIRTKIGQEAAEGVDDTFEAANSAMDALAARRDTLLDDIEVRSADRRAAFNKWKPADKQTPAQRVPGTGHAPVLDATQENIDVLRASLDPELAGWDNTQVNSAIERARKQLTDAQTDAAQAVAKGDEVAESIMRSQADEAEGVLESLTEEYNTRRAIYVLDQRYGKSTVRTQDAALNTARRELGRVTTELNTLNRAHGRYIRADEVAAESSARIAQMTGDIRAGYEGRLRQALASRGTFSPEDIEKAVRFHVDRVIPEYEKILTESAAAGLPEKARYGAGATGYMPHMEKAPVGQVKQSYEKFMGRTDLTDMEIRRTGMEPPATPTPYGRSGPGYGTIKPTRPYERVLDTQIERIGQDISTELDPAALLVRRTEQHGRQMARGVYEDGFVAAVGKGEVPVELASDSVALSKYLDDNNLAVHKVTRDGVTRDILVDRDMETSFVNLGKLLDNDEEMARFWSDWNRLQGVFKRAATTYNPGFHGRNAASNLFLLTTEGIGNISGVIDGVNLVRKDIAGKIGPDDMFDLGKSGRVRTLDFLDEARGQAIRTRGMVRSDAPLPVARDVKVATARAAQPWIVQKINPKKMMEELGELVEDGMRVGGYINARRMGLDPEAAGTLAIRAMYDYSPAAKSKWERKIARFIPFIAWQRANIPHMLEWAAKNPGKASAFNKMRNAAFASTGMDATTLPDYMKEQGALPIPGLTDPNGNPLMLNPNLPLQDLGRLPTSPQGAWEWALSSVTPFIKTPMDMAYNKAQFTGLPLEDYPGEKTRTHGVLQQFDTMLYGDPRWEQIKSNVGLATQFDSDTQEPYLAASKEFNSLIALQPWVQNLGKSVDTRAVESGAAPRDLPDSLYKMLSWLVGLKMTPADTAKYELNQTRARDRELSDEQRRLRDQTPGLRESGW